MIKKFKKTIAYGFIFLTTVFIHFSCQNESLNAELSTINLKKEKLTDEEIQFLNDLDGIIEIEIFKSKTSSTEKNGHQIDPTNPSNPYDTLGLQIKNVFQCVIPHVKEAISGDINECPSKIINECSKTGECVCYGQETNVKKLLAECINSVIGVSPDISMSLSDFQYKYNFNSTSTIDNINASTLLKEIIKRYVNVGKNLKNVNSFINISKGFENSINNSGLLSANETKVIVSAITTSKYIAFEMNNLSNNEPLYWPNWEALGCSVAGAVLSTSFGMAFGLGGALVSGLAYAVVCSML